MNRKNWLYVSFVALVFASNICAAQGGGDANRTDLAARKAESTGNIFASTISTVVHPVGTKFIITAVHSSSAWTLSDFSGQVATATTCSGSMAGASDPGISIITYGDRKDYYMGCFYLAGDSFQYFVYGFKFTLVNSTPTPPPVVTAPVVTAPVVTTPVVTTPVVTTPPTSTPTAAGATYSNGVLTIKSLAVDAGVLGKTYYDVTMTLKALSNPLTFTVDSAVPSK